MNSAIFVVLVLLWGAECRPIGQDVLAGEDFLAFLMRSHRPRSQQIVHHHQPSPPPTTTTVPVTVFQATTTEGGTTETETAATTALETEPPSIVSVRVSSSVRKEALHENNVNSVLPAANTRSHFGVEAAGYREAVEKIEDSVAEASQDFPSATHDEKAEEKKPYAEALTFEESGLGYESRVSSETSQSRVYFSRPEPVEETVVVQTSQTRKYETPIVVAPQAREERKYVPQYQNIAQNSQLPTGEERQYSTQSIVSQTREERQYTPQNVISHNRDNRQQFSNQPIISHPGQEGQFESQKILGQKPTEQRDYRHQQQIVVEQQYVTQPPPTTNHHQEGFQAETRSHEPAAGRNFESPVETQREERHYEQPEENYEVDEAISVMSNGRAHGVQTERPESNKFGLVQEGRNYRKYRVEEKTPDGFIVGEYGVVNHDDGRVRGVRYTADGSISPRLIYEALVKFLSLK